MDGGCHGTYGVRRPIVIEITYRGGGETNSLQIFDTIHRLCIYLQARDGSPIDGRIPCRRRAGAAGKAVGDERQRHACDSICANCIGEASLRRIWGTPGGLGLEDSSSRGGSRIPLQPCNGISASCPQSSQMSSPRTFFLCKFTRHWMCSCSNCQPKKRTRGVGAVCGG